MKIKGHVLGSFLMFILSIFLPWFTFNAKIMGYCWGWHFLKYFAVPILVIIVYLIQGKGKAFSVLAEFAVVTIFSVYVLAFVRWQELFHIAPGFQWMEGFYTATVGYWVSFALFLLFSVLFQIKIFRKLKTTDD